MASFWREAFSSPAGMSTGVNRRMLAVVEKFDKMAKPSDEQRMNLQSTGIVVATARSGEDAIVVENASERVVVGLTCILKARLRLPVSIRLGSFIVWCTAEQLMQTIVRARCENWLWKFALGENGSSPSSWAATTPSEEPVLCVRDRARFKK